MQDKKQVRTRRRTTDWFQNGERSTSRSYVTPCLLNLYAGYIMQNARLDESQTGIKITRRNINNLRNADDTTVMAESEEELKSLLMRVKEESEKAGLKLNIQKTRTKKKKTRTMTFGPIILTQIDRGKVETVVDFIFLGSKITDEEGDCSHEITRSLFLGRKAITNLDSN